MVDRADQPHRHLSKTPPSISRRTAPSTTTSSATPTSTSCGTSPPRAARARAVLHAVRSQPHHCQGHRHLASQRQGRHHRLRPHLRLGLAAAEGGRRGRQTHHARRTGKDMVTAGAGPHEHDPARLPDRQRSQGQHAGCAQVQGRRAASHLRLRRRQSAVLGQDVDHRPHSADAEATFQPLRMGRSRRQSRAITPISSHIIRSMKSSGQSCLHSSARCAFPRRRRGRHPPAARSAFRLSSRRIIGLPRQPLLRHRHPGLHRGARQRKCRRPQGRLHDRRLQRLHARTAPRTGCVSRTSTRSSTPSCGRLKAPGYARMVPARRDRRFEERLQP